MLISINKNNRDPFYRYKMPHVIVKQEGKSKNIKTLITNMNSISNALKRQEALLQQFLMYQLSVNSTSKNNTFSLKGEFSTNELQNLIFDFVDILVLCRECENPETRITLEDQNLFLSCYACGRKTMVESNHKILNYIRKNESVIHFECYENNDEENEDVREEENMTADSLKEKVRENLDSNFLGFYNANPSLKKEIITEAFGILAVDYGNLRKFEEVFKADKQSLSYFFEALEVFLVENNKIKEMKEIFENLEFIRHEDFDYFKKKSKVVDKKESVKIRNTLMSFIDFK